MTVIVTQSLQIVITTMLAILLLAVSVIGGEDDGCFLTGGGSTESFFVPEDVPVGSVLGHLSVKGRDEEK